jgi:hypothetical protein
MKRILWLLISGLALLTCQKREELPSREYPRLITLPVADIEPGSGVTLRGELLTNGGSPVIEYGFVWSSPQDQPVLTGRFERISVLNALPLGPFEGRADFGHLDGNVYNVRAYVRTADYTVYGNTLQFTSRGCSAPVVQSFSPRTASWGDTVVIRGERFSALRERLKVYFVMPNYGWMEAPVVRSTPREVACTVPTSLSQQFKNIKIQVDAYGRSGTSTDEFILDSSKPVVTSFSPESGTFGDRLTLKGSGFAGVAYLNRVSIGGQDAKVLEATKTQLLVEVPAGVTQRTNQVTVQLGYSTGSGEPASVAPSFFIMNPPMISSLTLSANGQTLEIQGGNFHPEGKANLVLVGPNEAVPAQGVSSSSLSVPLTTLLFPRPTATFTVSVTATGQQSAEKSITLTYRNRWVKRGNERTNPFSATYTDSDQPVASFTFGGRAYLVVSSSDSYRGKTRLYEYNPATYTWQQRADPPLAPSYDLSPATFVIGGKAYLLARYGEFWEYDVAADRWQRLAGAPSCSSGSPFRGFALNGRGYVIAPKDVCSNTQYWKYDPATNQWQAKPGGPNSFNIVGAYETGNRAFVLVRADNYYSYRLLEYVATTNTWVEKAGLDSVGDTALGFWANGQLILTTGERTYRYDPDQNRWTIQSGFGGSLYGASGVGFAVGNQGFLFFRQYQYIVAQGRSFSNNLHFWEYDPSL